MAWDFGTIVFAIIVGIFILSAIFGDGNKNKNSKGTKKKHNTPYAYAAKYESRKSALALPSPDEARSAARTIPGCKFMLCAKKALERDYVLIIDRSASMHAGTRWKDAQEAVRLLAPHITKHDPDGITLMFFDHEIVKVENVMSADQVNEAFTKYPPRGSTDLAKALDDAFTEHFEGSRGATTILCITDGAPNSQQDVQDCIVAAANALEVDPELSLSFIQIGNDRGATNFLKKLDDELEGEGCKFDIVDTLTSEQQKNISFSELIAMSIYD